MPGYASVDIFIRIIQPYLEQLSDPGLDCLNEVHMYLETLADSIAQKVFVRFPVVIPLILESVNRVLGNEKERARKVVQGIIDAESNYLFTNDQSYIRERSEVVPGLRDVQNMYLHHIK